jgi:peptidyl-prolyl cis-trans isomerase D
VDKFEAGLRDEIAQSHLVTAIVDGLRAPRAYSALGVIYMTESRDIGYFTVGPGAVPAVAPPTDAQLNKFMQENAARLMKPEFRVLTVVRFSPSQLGANLPVTEADIQKQFDFRKDTLNKPEVRSVIQIPGKDAATAQAIAARLTKGEDPRVIAKSYSVEAIGYADKPKAAIADQKVGNAAFTMAVGAVQVVQGDLGLAVIKVVGVTPGQVATLQEVRPMLEAEARKTAAAEKVYELSQKYDDARAGGATLTEASAKAGVATITLGPLTEQGVDMQGQPVSGLTQRLVQSAFALPQGGESEIEDEGNGESFAVRVDKIIPKALPALSEVRPQLTQIWMAQEVAKRLRAKAEELTARVAKGESLESVAGSVGANVSHVVGIDRQNAGQNKDLSQESLGKIFGLKVGEAFNGEDAKVFGIAVGKVEALRGPVPTALGRMTEGSRQQLTQTLFREIGTDARKAARNTIKPKTYPNVARVALGLEPLDTKKDKAPEKKK